MEFFSINTTVLNLLVIIIILNIRFFIKLFSVEKLQVSKYLERKLRKYIQKNELEKFKKIFYEEKINPNIQMKVIIFFLNPREIMILYLIVLFKKMENRLLSSYWKMEVILTLQKILSKKVLSSELLWESLLIMPYFLLKMELIFSKKNLDL